MPHSLRPEQLLATILSSTEDGLLSFSLDGIIQSWSRGAEQLYGFAEEEIVGQAIKALLPICEVPVCEEFLKQAKDRHFTCCENADRLHKDRTMIRVTLKRGAIRDENGAIIGILEAARVHTEGPEAGGQLRSLVEQMPAMLCKSDCPTLSKNTRGKPIWQRATEATSSPSY